jgi:hypothetical protein
MNQCKGNCFSTMIRGTLVAGLVLLGYGCGGTLPKVDPYASLLPAGTTVVDSTAPFSAATLKPETGYLVVGTNFVNYVDVWSKTRKTAEQGGNLAFSQASMLEMSDRWSPARTTGLVIASLQKHFKNVVVVEDLADARTKGAKWIVMFDHAYIQPSWMTTTWTNTTTIDLLNNNFRRVADGKFSEIKHHDVGSGEAAALRITQLLGDDVLRSVNAAIAQFDAKLAARQ